MKTRTEKPQAGRSLTATLTAAFLVLSVVILFVTSSLQTFSNMTTQQAAVADKLQLYAQDASQSVSSFIQDKFSVLATGVQLTNPTLVSPLEQRQILEGLLGRDLAFRQLVLFNVQDQELARVSRLSQVAAGRLPNRLTGEVLTQIKQGENYIGPVYIDSNTSEPLVLMAIPATDALGDFQGTLAAEVNLKFMWDLVDQLKVGETGVAYVVDRQGNLLAFNDTARVLRGENVANLDIVRKFSSGPASVPARLLNLSTGIRGTLVVAADAPLGTPDWAVVAELPAEEAYRTVIQNGIASAVILAIMSALAGLVGVYLARRLAVPLVNLTATATRIADGEMDLQAVVRGPSEVTRLAAAFNSMTQQLRSFIGGLEQRVDERTHELARRSNYLEVTARVARDVAETLELQDLLPQVVNVISEQFGFYHTGIFLMDTTGEWAELKAASSAGGKRMLERGHRLHAEDRGIVGTVAYRGQSRIALDTGADAVFLQNPDLPDTRSEIALPLRVRGRAGRGVKDIIGVLDVQSTEPQAFSHEDAAVLQTLADQVALAISNAQLFQQAEASLEAERRAYGEWARVAWKDMLQFNPNLGYLYRQGNLVRLEDQPATRSGVKGPAENGNGDMSQKTSPSQPEALPELKTPIRARGNVIGVINAHKPGGAGEWTPEEIALIESLTEQLGVALEGARVYQDSQRRAAREQIIGQVTSRMRATLDVETVLETALNEIHRTLGLDEATIHLATGEAGAEPTGNGRE